jgi:D-3-phosphoglycerate dehydrogenase
VNCARGGIVNEADLLRALESGKVAGAALDVFEKEPPPPDHPLFARDDVVLTPHLGASTSEAQTRASVDLCKQVIDYLFRGEARNVVNLPRMDPRTLAELKPWMDLAHRLGRFLAGLHGAPCEKIEVATQGNLSTLETGPVTRSFVAGLLSPAFAEPVNFVNALSLAESRGLAVVEKKSERIRDFASMLTGTATAGGSSISVSGTLFGHRQPRIVKMDDFHLEAIPEGNLLVIRNDDKPGVIGRIGTILGAAGTNIRAMHLSPPRERDGQAIVLLNLSSPPPDDALAKVRAQPEVHRLAVIELEESRP